MFFEEFNEYLRSTFLVSNMKNDKMDGTAPTSVKRKVIASATTTGGKGNSKKMEEEEQYTTSNTDVEWLDANLKRDVMPQIHRIVALTLHAARNQMEGVAGQSFGSFNLFGYDFMLDEKMNVTLLEINSSPAVADVLLNEMTVDVVNAGILPFYEDGEGGEDGGAKELGGFEKCNCTKWLEEMETSRLWK